jgi:RNA-directed DNA polymerase
METERTKEATSPPVVATSKRGEEVRARWAWTEPAVWTESMLDALENGVQGGRWYSLIDKVWKETNLKAAWKRVKGNRGASGVDKKTVHEFGRHVGRNFI